MTTEGRLSSKERKYRSGTNSDYLWLVDKPYKYSKDWTIWPNTILNKMEMSDCNDTIDGVCLKNKTLDECIDRCTGDCGAGIYFKFYNGESICIPLRTALYPNFNPIYRLRKQEYYDIKDVNVSVFVNTKLFPNPPDLGNAVLYFDIITMQDGDGGTITNNYIDNGDNLITVTKNFSGNIQITPQIHATGSLEDNIPLTYGDKINIFIPGTNLTATNKGNNLSWTIIPETVANIEQGITQYLNTIYSKYYMILPVTGSTKKIGDVVTNKSPFVLKYNGLGKYNGYINVNSHGQLVIEDQQKSTFSIISKMVGYYCDNTTCNKISLEDITPSSGTGGKYKDSSGEWTPIYRHKGCWNRCAKKKSTVTQSQSSNSWYWVKLMFIIIGVVILLYTIIYYIR
jgi:hypothetical protein